MEKLAQILTNAIQRENPGLTELQVKTIKFGLECLLGEFSKLLMYFIIFSIFSLTQHFFIAVIFFCTLRIIAGGYHEETYWRCFFTSFLIFTAIISIGTQIPLSIYIKASMLLISIILAWIYAPVDHPNKPIVSVDRRKRFKYLSVGAVVLMGGVSLLLPSLYSGTAVAAIFFESISLPIGEFAKKKRKKNF
ncbi:MAG: accessory regulator [Petroclostridium sp.]|nr:accessory regulator [Petroclostridium sp.]